MIACPFSRCEDAGLVFPDADSLEAHLKAEHPLVGLIRSSLSDKSYGAYGGDENPENWSEAA
jgi:hypothetical protein